METRKTFARVIAVALSALLAVAVSAQPGQASHTGGGYFDPPTSYHNSGTFDPECGDVDATVHFWLHGVHSLRFVKGSHRQAYLLEDNVRFYQKWRDSKGETILTYRAKFHYKDFFAKRVPKSQVPDDAIPPEGLVGPIYLFRARLTGREVVRDDDGNVLHRTRGMQAFAYLFDTLGDGAPGGTELTFDITKTAGNFPPLTDEEMCALAE